MVVKGEYAYLKNSSNFKLSLRDDQLYVNSESYEGFVLNSDSDLLDTTKKRVTLILFNEIIKSKNKKIEVTQPENPESISHDYVPYSYFQSTCSYWNTVTRAYYGMTRSNAEAEASYQMSQAQQLHNLREELGYTNSCEPFGSIDSSCIYGDHFCVATYSVCCD